MPDRTTLNTQAGLAPGRPAIPQDFLASQSTPGPIEFIKPDPFDAAQQQAALRKQQSDTHIQDQLHHLEGLLNDIRDAHNTASRLPPSREINIVRTKLHEAMMWASVHGQSLFHQGYDFLHRASNANLATTDLFDNPFKHPDHPYDP